MGIFIKNPEVERKARELARLRGQTLTTVIGEALDRRTRFRRSNGLDRVEVKPMTKKDWDALWPTGIPEIDDA